KNYLPVEIYLPKDFEDGIKNKIVNRIEQNTGMKVVPKFIIDPRIIGGFKIKIDDWVYDVTLRNKIDSLFKELVSTMKFN
ncbi:MAG: F0F1 ATP synthase subunit delta, partial [Candidatus Kapaibacteriota bacterium]